MNKPIIKTTFRETFGDSIEEFERNNSPWKRKNEKKEDAKNSPWNSVKKNKPEKIKQDPPWLRSILDLATEKGRIKEGLFLAEGVRVVMELIEYHSDLIQGIYTDSTFDNDSLREKALEKRLHLHLLTDQQMKTASSVMSGQGVFAICRLANVKPNYDTAHVLTLVDAVQDPGNLGALFRTSVGFGVDGMILGRGTVDPFNSKVVRGSSGVFLRMPFETGIDLHERFSLLKQKGFCIVATSPHAKKEITELSPFQAKKIAILIGNEGAGTDTKTSALADEWVRIPIGKDLESLNVAVAHGILCYQIEQMRKINEKHN